MARTLSEFHYTTIFIEGGAFANAERFHDEMTFKLGLPSWYGRNWDALLDCLSSIGDLRSNLCRHWQWQTSKRLVLLLRGFSIEGVDIELMNVFAQTVADANNRLEESGAANRIWIEYMSDRTNR
jgi:hypothetical protein